MRRSTALMAAAALLLLLSSPAVSAVPYDERSEEVETRRMFRDWMARFNKTYSSIDEEEHRYAVFKENLRRRGKQNAADEVGVHLDPNVFGDLTDEEKQNAAAEVGVHLGLNRFGDLTHEELSKIYNCCTDYKYSLLDRIKIFLWGVPACYILLFLFNQSRKIC